MSAKSGCSLGNTVVNSSFVKVLDISKTLGRIKGSKYGSFICLSARLTSCITRSLTSSNRLGRIFPFRRRSENVGRTRTSPRKNVAFSSRGFEANVVGSKKLSVEIASDEKKEWEGSEPILSRFDGCLVSNRGNKSIRSVLSQVDSSWLAFKLCAAPIPFHPGCPISSDQCSLRIISQRLHRSAILERRLSSHVYRK